MDELHSIENKADKICIVLLTLFLVAVQQARSLTGSKVFPVGGESGAQASSLRPSTELEVISESGNGSCWSMGRRSRGVRAQALASPSGTAVPGGTKPGACEGDRAWRAQLFKVPDRRETIGPRAGGNPALGGQVALTCPTACQPRTGRPADGRHPTVSLRGAARVYSELLVEANRRL